MLRHFHLILEHSIIALAIFGYCCDMNCTKTWKTIFTSELKKELQEFLSLLTIVIVFLALSHNYLFIIHINMKMGFHTNILMFVISGSPHAHTDKSIHVASLALPLSTSPIALIHSGFQIICDFHLACFTRPWTQANTLR